jgi:hypothetical protein
MATSGKLPAKKRPMDDFSEYDPCASDGSSNASSSSASFQMQEPSSDEDEEIIHNCGRKNNTFQVKLMDSQETHMSLTPNLGTQPPPKATPRPVKKRKVSLSPRDSLARAVKSPEAVVVINDDNADPSPVLKLQKTSPTVKMTKFTTKQSAPLTTAQPPPPVSSITVENPTEKEVAKSDSPPPKTDSKVENVTTTPLKKKSPSKRPKKTKTNKKAAAKSEQKKPSFTTTKDPNKATPTPSDTSTATSTKKAAKATTKASSAPKTKKATPAKKSKKTAPDNCTSVTAKKAAAKSTTKTAPAADSSTAIAKKTAESPKKKKPKKKTFQDELLHHMFFTCKPFAMKTLTQELKTSEASVNFCLLSLIDKGWVVKKEFASKSRSKELYWANQEAKSKELFTALHIVPPEQVAAARRELAHLQQQEKAANQQLHQVQQEPSNEELNSRLTVAEQEVRELEDEVQAALSRIRAAKEPKPQPKQRIGFGKPKVIKAKPTCPKRLKAQINKMRDEWRKRKEKCNDFIEQLADGMEKKVKDVVKMLELETDEVVGVKMPPKHVIDKK